MEWCVTVDHRRRLVWRVHSASRCHSFYYKGDRRNPSLRRGPTFCLLFLLPKDTLKGKTADSSNRCGESLPTLIIRLVRTHVHTPTYTNTQTYTSAHIHTRTHTRTHVYTHTYSHTHTYTYTHLHVHAQTPLPTILFCTLFSFYSCQTL